MEIGPHPGHQEQFLSTPADIGIYGGMAGGGKTFALLLEPLRHISTVDGFGAVIFRRTSPQIRREGGLWDESQYLYNKLGAHSRESYLEWIFPPFANKVTFAAMEHESDRYDWDGSQIALLGFDQLEHFTERQFFYMLSRNRSTCGVVPYIRATANPDPDSFLATFIAWWINQDTGYPIKEREGILRYFCRMGDEMYWANTSEELVEEYGEVVDGEQLVIPLSVTFIPASVNDNPTILKKDPLYKAKLRAMPLVERERLEKGNWKIRPAAGNYFRRPYFPTIPRPPDNIKKSVRYWDLGSRESKDADWTAGVKISETSDHEFIIEHIIRFQRSPAKVKKAIMATAELDGKRTIVGFSQDPGQAGKAQIEDLVRMLAGYNVKASRETGEKTTRASPLSAQAEHGNVKIVEGMWVEPWMIESENFPEGRHDDQVDAAAGALRILTGAKRAGTWGRG